MNKYEFTPEELRKLQLKSLDLALYFKKICEDNNLLFYFCGGCCIGTIRHEGFIPWDDDVDVFMPRKDYNKLIEIWNRDADTSRYSIYRASENIHTHNIFTTVNDNNTTFIKPIQADLDINHGIVLDILPLDGYPSSSIGRKIQVFWALIYSLYCSQLVPTNHGKMVSTLGKIALVIVKSKNIRYKIWKYAEKQMTKYDIDDCEYITELCSGPMYMKKKYPRKAFEKAIYKKFEGHMMPIPIGYNDYLTIAFGDYMKLPPKEKQVGHHDVVYCDLNNSYKKYKGIYYCTDNEKSKSH